MTPRRRGTDLTLLSAHGMAVVLIASDPDQRITHIAERLGLSRVRAMRVMRDLSDAGVITTTRTGRSNRYVIDFDHRLPWGTTLAHFVETFNGVHASA